MVKGTPEEILSLFTSLNPEIAAIEQLALEKVKRTKREVYPYQSAALYHYAKPYNGPTCRALEIGTAYGYSCFYLAMAMPNARITTLNPKAHEAEAARVSLAQFQNVEVVEYLSWDYYSVSGKFNREYDFIFVDGDHKRVKNDLPWFNRLRCGGMMIFHDYSPDGSSRACPPVYEAVNEMAKSLGRDPNVLVIDNNDVGMAGFIRKCGETLEA